MSQEVLSLTKKKVEVHVANVKRHDGPLLLPENMRLDDAINVLTRKKQYDSEKVVVTEVVNVFPWDGALALQQAIEEMFGIAMQTVTPTWFGDQPPQMISIEVAHNKTRKVPWGRFTLPGIKGWVSTNHEHTDDGRVAFKVVSEVTHADEDTIKRLIERTREIALKGSLYRGQAINVRFTDDDGDVIGIPTPKFIRLTDARPIFSRELEQAIETNVLTPIRHTAACRKAGIPIKRGVLLAGPYGTGKTLTANEVASEAVQHGWTFIYVRQVEELASALRFAQDFQPAVVFAEDVDRAAGSERTADVNELLNTLDGIGSKSDEIMTVLTSNHAESINAAMRRPGRIDVVLSVDPPDAEAAMRLMRLYGGELIETTENLMAAGEVVKGQIPAVIREVVERAKLEAIRRAAGHPTTMQCADLEAAARTLVTEQKLFKPKVMEVTPMQAAITAVTDHIDAQTEATIAKALKKLETAVGIR